MQGSQNKNDISLEGAIVRTIAFFDLFDCPLTDWEAWQWLYEHECEYEAVREILLSGNLKEIQSKNGFYFLPGREEIVRERMNRYNATERKFRRALMVMKLFRFIPWIKSVAIGNNIGAHNLKDSGDIDFFIITEKGRIWAVRFFCVLLIKLLGMRPRENKTKDKICLSFFATEEALSLEGLMIENDIYFIYWLAGLNFIYGDSEFWKENAWLKKYLPNFHPKVLFKRNIRASWKIFKFAGKLEFLFKKLQMKLLPDDLRKAMNAGTDVVINDQVLKLHANDRRGWYRNEWRKRSCHCEERSDEAISG